MEKQETNKKFYPITYIDNADTSAYKEALDTAINNNHIHNVAISGYYGSGKTSILRSYFKNKQTDMPLSCFENTQIRPFWVSLTNFNKVKKEEKEEDTFTTIETAILQQLFYSTNENKTKHSKISRIRTLDAWNSIKFTLKIITILIWLFSFYLCYKLNKTNELNISTLMTFLASNNQTLITFLVSTILVGIIFHSFTLRFSPKKLSLAGLSIESDNNNDKTSLLNKNIDELIYFFRQHKNVNIIIFEDLDRFNSLDIFEKLREINKIINDYFKNRTIKFFYVIRNDIFKRSVDYAKFFDVIITIVPIIDFKNSYTEFLNHLNDKTFNKEDSIGWWFIKDISQYLTDLRLIKTIANDYHIYSKITNRNSSDIDKIKLLSIMIYKNIWHTDFSEITARRGEVFSYIREKHVKQTKYPIKWSDDLDNNEKHLITFLLEKNYIDDTYYLYITRFDNSTLNESDTLLFHKLRYEGYEALNFITFDDKINNPGNFLEELNPFFTPLMLLNNTLLDYALENDTRPRIVELLETLRNYLLLDKTEKNYQPIIIEFIVQYINRATKTYEFITWLFLNKTTTTQEIKLPLLANDNLASILVPSFIRFYNSGNNFIARQEITNFINTKKINELENIFIHHTSHAIIKLLNPIINNLTWYKDSDILIKFLYDNGFFAINKDNLVYLKDFLDEGNIGLCSCIHKSSETVNTYIDKNFPLFIKVLLAIDNNQETNQDVILKILNSPSIEIANKNEFIEQQNFIFDNFTVIPDNFKITYLSQNKIKTSWENAITIYQTYGTNQNFIDFLKKNAIALSKQEITIESPYFPPIFNLLYTNNFDNETFRLLIKSNTKYSPYPINTTKEKLIIAIEEEEFSKESRPIAIKNIYPTITVDECKASSIIFNHLKNNINGDYSSSIKQDVKIYITNLSEVNSMPLVWGKFREYFNKNSSNPFLADFLKENAEKFSGKLNLINDDLYNFIIANLSKETVLKFNTEGKLSINKKRLKELKKSK